MGLGARNLTRDTVLASRLEVAGSLWQQVHGPDGPVLTRRGGRPLAARFERHPHDVHAVPDRCRLPRQARRPTTAVRPVVSVHPGLRAWTGLVPFVRGAHGVLELPVGTIERVRDAAWATWSAARPDAAPEVTWPVRAERRHPSVA